MRPCMSTPGRAITKPHDLLKAKPNVSRHHHETASDEHVERSLHLRCRLDEPHVAQRSISGSSASAGSRRWPGPCRRAHERRSHRRGRIGVTEAGGNRSDVVTAGDGVRRGPVPQIVQPPLRIDLGETASASPPPTDAIGAGGYGPLENIHGDRSPETCRTASMSASVCSSSASTRRSAVLVRVTRTRVGSSDGTERSMTRP